MRRALVFLCLAAAASGDERAFLETVVEREAYFVHEPIRLRLRVGFDRSYFKKNVVRMFQQDLDVQMKVEAPWLDELAGALVRARDAGAGKRLSFALNDDVAEARARDDEKYTVLEIERTYVPTRAGELVISAPLLRFAYGTQFKEDLFDERIATDRRDARVEGRPLRLAIRALPDEGRPADFTGAVGRFSVRADAAPRTLDAGAILKLTLRIEGEGNLDLFEAPRLGLAGFHVYGTIDDRGATRRTITYDLAPLDGTVQQVPAIPFAFFDPRAAEYREVRTQQIPLEVRGGEPAPTASPTERSWWPVWIGVAALAALVLWLRARKRVAQGPDPAATFRAHVGGDPAAAFTEYLAARLGCPAASVITPDLPERLAAAGVPADLAARTAELVEELVGARYGGTATEEGEAAARELVDALERVF